MKLVRQLRLPLLGQVGWAEDGHPPNLAAVQEFSRDEACLDRLADANVVGDQEADGVELQGHEQGDELVGPGLDADLGERPERSGTGAEPEPHRISKQAATVEVAELLRVREVEVGGLDRLQREIDPGDLVLGATKWTDHEQLIMGTRQDDPFPATGSHERTHGEAHFGLPKMLW